MRILQQVLTMEDQKKKEKKEELSQFLVLERNIQLSFTPLGINFINLITEIPYNLVCPSMLVYNIQVL